MMSKGYSDYATGKYDKRFKDAKEIRWEPWVGNRYDEARIMIVGHSTYSNEDPSDGWYKAIMDDAYRDANRELALGHGINPDNRKPKWSRSKVPYISRGYYNTTKMFLEAANKQYGDMEARELFWQSVAFFNFYQCAAPREGRCGADSHKALMEILKILKPRLCITWTTNPGNFGLQAKACGKKIVRSKNQPPVQPRVADIPHGGVVAGILHPSGSKGGAFNIEKWMHHLRNETPQDCQNEMRKFLDHLKTA